MTTNMPSHPTLEAAMNEVSADVLQNLIDARELISDFNRWTQGVMARDAVGTHISVHSDEAVAWCALGALDKTAKRTYLPAAFQLGNAIKRNTPYGHAPSVSQFNDALLERSPKRHVRVLAMFDDAIAWVRDRIHAPS